MVQLRKAYAIAIGICLISGSATEAAIITTVDAPGVQTSSAINTTSINFDSLSTGYKGSLTFDLTPTLTATYSGTMFIESAGQYGGAGGTGNYFSIQATQATTLTLSESQAYFGMWLSAADPYNEIAFYNGATEVGSFSTTSSLITSLPAAYLGNPNSAFLGEDPTEQFVYVNFYAQTAADMFNTIVFTNLPGPTEFESDNHTFSETLQAPAVPEPSSLVLAGSAAAVLVGFWKRLRKI